MAGNPEITEEGADYDKFMEALNYINTCLSKKIAGDGEGASALFEVKVTGAASKADAVTLEQICRHIDPDEGCDLSAMMQTGGESCVRWDTPAATV